MISTMTAAAIAQPAARRDRVAAALWGAGAAPGAPEPDGDAWDGDAWDAAGLAATGRGGVGPEPVEPPLPVGLSVPGDPAPGEFKPEPGPEPPVPSPLPPYPPGAAGPPAFPDPGPAAGPARSGGSGAGVRNSSGSR